MAERRYCEECKHKHYSPHWYGTNSFHYCNSTYSRLFRRGCTVCHPSWPLYEEKAFQWDKTGARICAAVYRKDVLAIREGAVIMSNSVLTPRWRMLVGLLASTYYFHWPAHAFILRIVSLQRKEPSVEVLAAIGKEVYDQFKRFRVSQGELTEKKGISCTKNPSERRCGKYRFMEIIDDSKAVLEMLENIKVYFRTTKTVSMAVMLGLFGHSCMYTKTPTYKNVRCCRILAEAGRKRFKDCIEDFEVYKRMSSHMRNALKSRGIDDFEVAMKFVKGMQETIGLKTYSMNDLIIYTCLLDGAVFDD